MEEIDEKNGEMDIEECNNICEDTASSDFPVDEVRSDDLPAYGNDRQANGAMGSKRQQHRKKKSNYRKKKRMNLRFSNGHMNFEEREYSLLEYTDHLQAQQDVESHFNKKFSFQKPPEAWKLPPADTMFTKTIWLDEDLQAAKASLNRVKEQLTYKDVADWHAHTKHTNPAENIVYEIKKRANPEMVTQAWSKFYEIVCSYNVIPLEDDLANGSEEEKENKCEEKPFNTLHLCEAPGAFVVSLNHYLVLHRPHLKWQWLANTINPYYEGSPSESCVVEDKLIFHTLKNWTFGESNTGDLMEKENLEEIVLRANYLGPIHLVTGDGSIDCQAAPGEQEKNTHNLQVCELVAALSVLAVGGTFVFKKFTMFESETVNLMYFLCCVFEEVNVLKPASSKEGNSEVYVVCLDYIGKQLCYDHLVKLLDRYGNYDSGLSMFDIKDLPQDFMLQLKSCIELFKYHQIKTIKKNISSYGKVTEKDRQYLALKKSKANKMFFERNYCTRIQRENSLTQNKVAKGRYLMETDLSKPVTSCFVRAKDSNEKYDFAKKYMIKYIEEFSQREWVMEISKDKNYGRSMFPVIDLEEVDFDVLRGKPYTTIKASKFCSQKVLECFRVVYNLWENLDNVPDLTWDESLLELVIKEHPDALVLKNEITYHPTCDLGAMLDVLCSIREKRLKAKSSFILFNVTLLSRLQCGLLCLLSSVFQNTVIYTSNKMGDNSPVILLENFKSLEHGEKLLSALTKIGWNPFDEDKAASSKILQIVSYSQLLENFRLCSLFYYNLHHCLHKTSKLLKGLEEIFK